MPFQPRALPPPRIVRMPSAPSTVPNSGPSFMAHPLPTPNPRRPSGLSHGTTPSHSWRPNMARSLRHHCVRAWSDSLIQPTLESRDGRDDVVKGGDRTEHHDGHTLVVALEAVQHSGRWRHGERAWRGAREVERRAVEEHPGMAHALGAETKVGHRRRSDVGAEYAVDVVVVPRDSLTFLTQLVPVLEPAAQPVQDDDLVPERPLGLDRGDMAHAKLG